MRIWMVAVAAILGACSSPTPPRQVPGADAERGLRIIEREACAVCHEIPGIAWPEGRVGGSLKGFATRPMIAGRFPNQPETLTTWLRDAPSLAPDTAMPASGLSRAEARDAAAYLYGLDD